MKLALAATFALGASTVDAVAVGTIDPAKKLKRALFENLVKRQNTARGIDGDAALNFALALEHLEATFYTQALAKFDQNSFDQAGYHNLRPLLEQVAVDEADHVKFFTTALKAANASAVEACNYTFPYTTVTDILYGAQVIENIGVSAYLGAAASAADDFGDATHLSAAGSILTVEARHSAFFQLLRRESPFPSPMDTPLSAREVVTVIKPFIESCPSGSAPTIPPFPALNFTSSPFFSDGKVFVAPVNASAVSLKDTVYCGFALGLSADFSVWSNGSCSVPTQDVIDKGQTYIFLTKEQSVADDSVLAGPTILSLSSRNVTVSIPNATLST